MLIAERIAYENAVEDCIRAVSRATDGNEADVLVDVFRALRSVMPEKSVRVLQPVQVNYLEQLQRLAQRAWFDKHGHGSGLSGVTADAVAGIETPIGMFRAVIWRRPWAGKRGDRLCWSTEYYLNDEAIVLDEIRAAGLAKGVRQRRAEAGVLPRRKKKEQAR
ncbi:hypothetical protein [Aminobacter ciceronei]|uniref:Uncharacterized protein n=1 Tax=Aminobacter ciceronei TaxID=150723 RepID=A0ABR6C0T2_9HYPH|nr:hypothetical protein [Aminobacter ciceronei]MBA8904860.1 hypothetical protein [Aminobacter ciceronei]MBA9018586.1 hypothetical protein [Aminobacter ciceronei]